MITCPLCTAVQYVNSTDDYKLNILARNLAEVFKEEMEAAAVRSCQICDSKATYECLTCKIGLCLKCRSSHLAEDAHYAIFELCGKHTLAKKFYCNNDNVVCCSKCWKIAHDTHNVIPIEGKEKELMMDI
jgi:hypothetical protein